jgi:thioredoxin-related protein
MKKLIVMLFFLFNSLLFADWWFSEPEDVESISVSQEQKVVKVEDSNLSPKFHYYDEALKLSKEQNKKILLEVVVDNCKFCEEMDKNLLSKESIQEAIAKDFIFAQVNANREPLPLGLSEQMSPMFVFISKDENIIDMRFGYIEELEFLKLLVEQGEKR